MRRVIIGVLILGAAALPQHTLAQSTGGTGTSGGASSAAPSPSTAPQGSSRGLSPGLVQPPGTPPPPNTGPSTPDPSTYQNHPGTFPAPSVGSQNPGAAPSTSVPRAQPGAATARPGAAQSANSDGYAECMALWNPQTNAKSREEWASTCDKARLPRK